MRTNEEVKQMMARIAQERMQHLQNKKWVQVHDGDILIACCEWFLKDSEASIREQKKINDAVIPDAIKYARKAKAEGYRNWQARKVA